MDATREQPTEETFSMISVTTIAKLAEAGPEEARGWTADPSFPEPIVEVSSGPLYDRRQVLKWLLEHDHKGYEIPSP